VLCAAPSLGADVGRVVTIGFVESVMGVTLLLVVLLLLDVLPVVVVAML
jgi:hypothetical protein